jgi:phospho-acceptor domain-containing protein
MGELVASLAHELNQPFTTVVTNAGACLRWLDRELPGLDEAREAVERIIEGANLAGDVIAQTRALLRKSAGDRTPLDIAETVRHPGWRSLSVRRLVCGCAGYAVSGAAAEFGSSALHISPPCARRAAPFPGARISPVCAIFEVV